MAYQKVYMNQIHSSSLLGQLSQMWKRDILCDAVICTGSVTTKAHRIVLVAACPMLQSMDGAAVGNRLEVKLSSDIHQESVSSFLQYLYDGFMMLTEDNVRDVEKIARMLQVDSVTKCCSDFYKVLHNEAGQTLGHDSKFSFHADEAEFRHVRASELLRSMNNGTEKRSLDSEEGMGRKKAKGHRQYPVISKHSTEDNFEYVQVENDVTMGVSRPMTQQSVSVSSRTDGVSQDVQVLNIADSNDYSGTHYNSGIRQLHSPYQLTTASSKSVNSDSSASRSSPSLQKQKSYTPTLRTPGGVKPRLSNPVSATSASYQQMATFHPDSLSSPVNPTLKPHVKSAAGQATTEQDGEQIVIQPMDVEKHRSSPHLNMSVSSPNLPPTLESDIQGSSLSEKGDSTALNADSMQDYADNSCPSSGPDMSIVKVEKTDYDDSYMTGNPGEDYNAAEEGDEDCSDTELYNYGDISNMSTSADDPASSWYTQTFKDDGRMDEAGTDKGYPTTQDPSNLTDYASYANYYPKHGRFLPAGSQKSANFKIGSQPVLTLKQKIVRALSQMKSPIVFLRPLQRKINSVKSDDLKAACTSLTQDGFGLFELKHNSNVLQRDAYFKPAPETLHPNDTILMNSKVKYQTYVENFNDVSQLNEEELNIICVAHPHKAYVQKLCRNIVDVNKTEQLVMQKAATKELLRAKEHFGGTRPSVPTSEEFRMLLSNSSMYQQYFEKENEDEGVTGDNVMVNSDHSVKSESRYDHNV